MHHAMAEQQWRLRWEAKLRALHNDFRILIVEGMPPSFPSL